MPFQATVNNNIGFGVVGEIFLEGPLRAQPGVLNSASAANNVVGRAFTIADDATASFDTAADPQPMEMRAGQAGVFAGILANPKVYANPGTVGDTLAANLTLANGQMAEFVEETAGMIVQLGAATAVGNWVYYTTATGVLVSAAPGIANAPANSTRVPGGVVVRYESAAAGLAVIAFNSTINPQEPEAP